MAAAFTRNNGRIRLEFSMPWYMRLTSLPFLAGGLYFAYYSGQILRQDLFGHGHWRDDWAGLMLCLAFALIIGVPGLALATLRYFVELDRILQQVIVIRQFGPVKFSSFRKLGEFRFLSITDDADTDDDGCVRSIFYKVSLCGGRGVQPIRLSSFDEREEATGFARNLGAALKLPAKDYVGTEPDGNA